MLMPLRPAMMLGWSAIQKRSPLSFMVPGASKPHPPTHPLPHHPPHLRAALFCRRFCL
jgi:hypothetical protein